MKLLEQISDIVLEAGEMILSAHDVEDVTNLKTSYADLVTAYDVKIENFLKEKLPSLVEGSIFYGEEEKENADPTKGWAFVVDPIDGTTNFVRGFRQSCVSVALAKDGIVQYAVIFDPYHHDLYTAKRGCGAKRNGIPMSVSNKPLSEGIFGMGTAPYNEALHAKTMELAGKMLQHSCDFRRMGSAALDLCAVASGSIDCFFECQLSPWDYAAGSLLVEEAGGFVSTMEGSPLVLDRKCSVWASNDVNKNILAQMQG